jgi:hypothetical protein
MTDSEKLSALLVGQAEILERVSLLVAGSPVNAAPVKGAIADDSDLDGPHGDPMIKYDPKKWIENGGKSFAGKRFSQCSPEYLDAVASFQDWKVKDNTKKPGPDSEKKIKFALLDGARARGWAKRLRENPPKDVDDSDIPF